MNEHNTIVWHCLPSESPAERDMRLSKDLHHIFFDCKPCNEICPENYLEPTHDLICSICGARAEGYSDDPRDIKHGTPPFLQSLDAMQLIVESGKFAEIREEFFHWLPQTGKPPYECRALTYNRKRLGNRMYFTGKGHSRQEAFYLAALASQGHTVIKEENNEHNEIH